MQLPESLDNLTEKQKAFAIAKASGLNNVEAAKQAFDVTSSDSAKALGCKLMKEPEMRTAIADLMAQEGIDRRTRVQQLKRLIMAPTDLNAVAKGLDMANKMTGEYVPENVNTDIDVNILIALVDKLPNIQSRIKELESEIASEESLPVYDTEVNPTETQV
jgi:ATP-dependent DNA ligase